MPGQASLLDEEAQLPLHLETGQAALSQYVASFRSARALWTGLGFAVVMMMGVAAIALHPIASHYPTGPSHELAYGSMLPMGNKFQQLGYTNGNGHGPIDAWGYNGNGYHGNGYGGNGYMMSRELAGYGINGPMAAMASGLHPDYIPRQGAHGDQFGYGGVALAPEYYRNDGYGGYGAQGYGRFDRQGYGGYGRYGSYGVGMNQGYGSYGGYGGYGRGGYR